MNEVRLAQASDLGSLLELFRAAEVSAAAEPIEAAERIWSDMLSHDGVAVFVSAIDARIVATCMLITAPNLLRAGRGHGFLENVVTHPEFRGQGHGRAVVHAALELAWARNCHHVFLQTGRKDTRVHRFYQQCGFRPRGQGRLRRTTSSGGLKFGRWRVATRCRARTCSISESPSAAVARHRRGCRANQRVPSWWR